LTVLDAVVAGDMNGPLAPRDVPLGAILASLDPVALDLAAIQLMGFDATRVPKVQEAMATSTLRITRVRRAQDVEIAEAGRPAKTVSESVRVYPLGELESPRPFVPHPGWLNHIEATADKNVPGATGSKEVTA
jgi:hypothetical protein